MVNFLQHPRREKRIIVVGTVLFFLTVGLMLWMRGEDVTIHSLQSACAQLLNKESFSQICPSSSRPESLRVDVFAADLKTRYKCTVSVWNEHGYGLGAVVDALETKDVAWRRLKERSTIAYRQKRGDVLGMKEPSILTIGAFGYPELTFVRDYVFTELTMPDKTMCTNKQFLDLGRFIYEKSARLPHRSSAHIKAQK